MKDNLRHLKNQSSKIHSASNIKIGCRYRKIFRADTKWLMYIKVIQVNPLMTREYPLAIFSHLKLSMLTKYSFESSTYADRICNNPLYLGLFCLFSWEDDNKYFWVLAITFKLCDSYDSYLFRSRLRLLIRFSFLAISLCYVELCNRWLIYFYGIPGNQ